MKLKNLDLLSIFILIYSGSTMAQKVKLLDGSFTEVKGQKSFNIKFSYDSILIGKTLLEKEYLQKKKKEWDLRDPSRGDAFVAQWYEDREDLYNPPI